MKYACLLFTLGIQFSQAAVVVRVDVNGVIHPVTAEIVGAAISQAEREQATLLLVRLNTPGGLMEATRETIEKIAASRVPIVSYVAPSGARAASAGLFLLLAGDAAAMAPGTRTGAASPVILGKEMDPVMRRKVESDAAASIRSLAKRRGRNAALAEKAVTEATSYTEDEALKQNLIDLIARNDADLFRQLSGREISRWDGTKVTLKLDQPRVEEYSLTLRQKIIQQIADPNIAFLFVVAGVLGLYLEFTMPGLIAPGIAGGLLLLLGLGGLSVLPINWIGAALLLLSLGLFVTEAFVTSHGILGAGGGVALVIGALLLVDGPPGVRIGLPTALAVGVPFTAISLFLANLVFQAHRVRPVTGEIGMVGKVGIARTALTPEGKVFVHGEYWNAQGTVEIAEGARVRVTGIDGLRLRVEPLP